MKENLVVMKFGGSCLQNAQSFEMTRSIIDLYLKKSKIIVICSAISGITDNLIDFYSRSCIEGNDISECQAILNKINSEHLNILDEIINKKNSEYLNCINFLKKNIQKSINPIGITSFAICQKGYTIKGSVYNTISVDQHYFFSHYRPPNFYQNPFREFFAHLAMLIVYYTPKL